MTKKKATPKVSDEQIETARKNLAGVKPKTATKAKAEVIPAPEEKVEEMATPEATATDIPTAPEPAAKNGLTAWGRR